MAQKINYPDKLTVNPSAVPEANKWTGPNGTEVKDVVNQNADELDAAVVTQGNQQIAIDANTGKAHDQNTDTGTNQNEFQVGDGAPGNKDLTANNGAANLPKFRWNETLQRWTFSNDGLVFQSIQASNSIGVGLWNFDIGTGDADPGAGNFRFDTVDPTLANFIYISNFNDQGLDVSEILQDLTADSNIGMQQSNNISKAILDDVTGAVVDGGTYQKIPIQFVSQGSGGDFDDTELVIFSFIPVGGGVVGTDEPERIDFFTDLDTSYQTVYLTPIQITDVVSPGITAVNYSATPDNGLFDFSAGVENDSLANLNIYLDGLADTTFVVVRTDVTLTRQSSIRRIKNLS